MRKHKTVRKHTESAFIEPMQCEPVTVLPTDEKWTFEVKFDGYRCIAVKYGSVVTLFSRNEKVLNERFPKVVDAIASLESDFVLDGELVAIDPQGRPSFQLLQNNQSRALPVYFYAFDLLNRDGESLVSLAIERRRELLERLLGTTEDPLRLSPLLRAPSGQVLEAVRKLGLEGVVGKRIDSTYEPGERSGAWIKHRTNRELRNARSQICQRTGPTFIVRKWHSRYSSLRTTDCDSEVPRIVICAASDRPCVSTSYPAGEVHVTKGRQLRSLLNMSTSEVMNAAPPSTDTIPIFILQ